MRIDLPDDLERFVAEQVRAGRYDSRDDVIRDALEQLRQHSPPAAPAPDPAPGSIGAMREDAAALDEVVAESMRNRRERPLRLPDGE